MRKPVGSARRAPTPVRRVSEIVLAAARRCCLCVWLEQDHRVKRLQIAHLDHDRTNSASENLVPLCLRHHDEYDSISRHTKALQPLELRHYRDEWFFVAAQLYQPSAALIRPGPRRQLSTLIRQYPEFRVYRRSANGDMPHEWLQLQVHGSHLVVKSTEWISAGSLSGVQFVGRFRYHRGISDRDHGTHDLTWNGTEFVGSVRFDYPGWSSGDIVWRPRDYIGARRKRP